MNIEDAFKAMNEARDAWKKGSTDRATALALHDNWLTACALWRALTAAALEAKKEG